MDLEYNCSVVHTTPENTNANGEQIYEWVKCSNGAYPDNAIETGVDEKSGARYLVARAPLCGMDTPGKFIAQMAYGIPFGCCYIPTKDSAIKTFTTNYEILTAPPGNVIWVPSSNGERVKNAIIGGKTSKWGENLYVGRAFHKDQIGAKIPGKICLSDKSCAVPYAGKVLSNNLYDILAIHPDKIPPPEGASPLSPSNFTWVKCHNGQYPLLNAVRDPTGQFLVCRAVIETKDRLTLMPGQFNVKLRSCSIPYYGPHAVAANYEILVADSNSYEWVHSSNGLAAQAYALPGGLAGDTSPAGIVYIGLGHSNGQHLPGCVYLNRKVCMVVQDGVEYTCKSYDVLLAKEPKDIDKADGELSRWLLGRY